MAGFYPKKLVRSLMKVHGEYRIVPVYCYLLTANRTNVDLDVVPLERRTWTAFTMFGFWFSDAMNAQSWMAPATILAVGLTW